MQGMYLKSVFSFSWDAMAIGWQMKSTTNTTQNSGGFVKEIVQHSHFHFCKQPGSLWHRSICLLYVCNCMLGVCCVITDIGGELFTEEGETETSHRSHCTFKFIEKEIYVNIGMLQVWKECLAPLQYFATRKGVSMKRRFCAHGRLLCWTNNRTLGRRCLL